LPFDGEVFNSKMILPVVSKRLVEGPILLLRNVTRVTCPNRLGFVELLVDLSLLLDRLLLVLGFTAFFVLDLLNLGLALFALFVFALFGLFGLFLLFILDLLRRMIRDN
jgi:hypothetical protein